MLSFHLPGELARAFRIALVSAFILIVGMIAFAERAYAQNASGPVIFDVRRSLPLEPDEEVTKDFYINAGPESGLKKGVYVSVVRALPIHNPIQNKQQAELNVPVGKLKVIDVQRGITVARLASEMTDDERPTLEFEGIMVGDHIDLGTLTTEAPKKTKAKTKKSIAKAQAENQDQSSAAAETSTASNVLPDGEAGAGSAEAMAARSAAPVAVSLTTTADVKPEASPSPAPSATNRSATSPSQIEEPTKKSASPKSAESPVEPPFDSNNGLDELNLEHPMKKGFPGRRTTDTVRVADYSDVGF